MLNKVMLIGNLGADPVHRVTNGNTDVTELRVATTEKWRDKDGGKHEETEWHKVILWSHQAVFARDYLKKGSKVYIEGKIQTRKWTDKDGVDRYTTEIQGKTVIQLDSKGQAGSQPSAHEQSKANAYQPQGDDDIGF